MNTTTETPFTNALREAIRAKIRELVKQGTCGMSLENLMQMVTPPGAHLGGAPCGTEAGWFYYELFSTICRENKDIAVFILP